MTELSFDQKLRKAIDEGAEISGGAIGGALGVISGDPALMATLGATGVAAGSALRRIGHEIVNRMLGPREQKRIGAVVAIIAKDIYARMQRGEKVRRDGFFNQDPNSRSEAEEVAESIFLKCPVSTFKCNSIVTRWRAARAAG